MSDAASLCQKAREHLKRRQPAVAIEFFHQAIELEELDADSHESLATAYFLVGQHEDAIQHFLRVTELDPRRGRPLVNAGAIYNRMGEYQKAVDCIRRGLQKEKKCSEGFYNLGIAYRRLDQLSMSVSAYKEAIRIDPLMADAHLNLGNVYLKMGNNKQAADSFRDALRVKPGFEKAEAGLRKAEEASRTSIHLISPFGRLVEPRSGGGIAGELQQRRLSEADRQKDRQELHQMAKDAERLARDLSQYAQHDLQHAYATLQKQIAQGGGSSAIGLSDAHREFSKAWEKFGQLRQYLRKKMLQIRAHEELMNAPEIPE